MPKTFVQVIYGPLFHNVLDDIDVPGLETRNGLPVKITRIYNDFSIQIGDGKPFVTGDNIQASYFLNSNEVGKWA